MNEFLFLLKTDIFYFTLAGQSVEHRLWLRAYVTTELSTVRRGARPVPGRSAQERENEKAFNESISNFQFAYLIFGTGARGRRGKEITRHRCVSGSRFSSFVSRPRMDCGCELAFSHFGSMVHCTLRHMRHGLHRSWASRPSSAVSATVSGRARARKCKRHGRVSTPSVLHKGCDRGDQRPDGVCATCAAADLAPR
jgi:hypothetical protein